MFSHFCSSFLDWTSAPTPSTKRANESLDLVDAEILRAINSMAWDRKPPDRPRVIAAYNRIKSLLPSEWALIAEAIKGNISSIRINENSAALSVVHRDIFARYGAMMVPPRLADKLFEPRDIQLRSVDGDYVWRPGVERALATLRGALLAAIREPVRNSVCET